MDNPILQLGHSLRKRQNEQSIKLIEPQIKEIRADYERQIADRDAQIAELHEAENALEAQLAEKDAELARLEAENQALRESVAQAEPPARTRKRKAK